MGKTCCASACNDNNEINTQAEIIAGGKSQGPDIT